MKKRKGFTLMELLATVIIIAILVGVGALIYVNFIDKGKVTISKITDESLANSAILYIKEFKMDDVYWYPEEDGSTNLFACTTVRKLKDIGNLPEKIVDAETGDVIPDETTIKVIRDVNKVIYAEVETNSADCNMEPPKFTITLTGTLIEDWYTGDLNYKVESEVGSGGLGSSDYYFKDSNGKIDPIDECKNKEGCEGSINPPESYKGRKICAIGSNINDISSEEYCKKFNLDNSKLSPPTVIANDGKASGTWHNKDFVLNISGGGTSLSGNYYQYGETTTTINQNVSNNKISVGNITQKNYYVRICNYVNNCSSATLYEAKLDKDKPQIISFTKSTDDYTTSLTLNAKVQDSLSGVVKYKIDTNSSYVNSGWTTVNATTTQVSFSKNITSNGTYYVWVEDAAGNYSSKSISVSNIAKIATTTVSLYSRSSSTITDKFLLNNPLEIKSVTLNNGTVSGNPYISGNYLYLTVTNGYPNTGYENVQASQPANFYNAVEQTQMQCYCPMGGYAQGTMCMDNNYMLYGTNSFYCSSNNSKWWFDGNSHHDCRPGFIKSDAYCTPPYTGDSCRPGIDTTTVTQCTAQCTFIPYQATCQNVGTGYYYCPYGGSLIGYGCYSCSVGILSYDGRCYYTTSVPYTYWSYTATITYYYK